MKTGIVPRDPYDAAARDVLQLASLRCSAIRHYPSWIPPILRVVRLSLNSGHLEQPPAETRRITSETGFADRCCFLEASEQSAEIGWRDRQLPKDLGESRLAKR